VPHAVRIRFRQPAEDGGAEARHSVDLELTSREVPIILFRRSSFAKATHGALGFANIICPKWYEAWLVRFRSTANRFRVGFRSNSSADTLPCLSNHSLGLRVMNLERSSV